jgi:hypothetical protein
MNVFKQADNTRLLKKVKHTGISRFSRQDSDTDWFTYCIKCQMIVGVALVLNIYLSESCFGNANKFLLPKHGVVLFLIYRTLYSLKILFTQPFSLQSHSRHK